jgi:serine protease Do
MSPEQILFELFDNYAKGKLSPEDTNAFDERMKQDAEFRQKAEQHLKLVEELKFYGNRNQLRKVLDEAHERTENPVIHLSSSQKTTGWKKYWPMTAVAASIALICIAGTIFITDSLESKQTADYKELRRNVDQIRKSQKMIMEDLAETKEKILPGKYAGTGFLFSAKGYVATSYHVVKEADSIVIENEKFGRLKASIVYSDPANDISILKIEKFKLTRALPFAVSSIEASLAEDVYTLGYPREDVVFGEGSVSALTGFNQNPNAYQVSVPVNPGNSGGPLLNSKGDLIGMISGFQTQTLGAAFAIKSTVLFAAITNPVLDTLSTPLYVPKQNTIKNTNRVQQVKQWKDFVFMVRVYKN